MLHIENLNAWYDRSHVLQGISLQVNKGEIVTLMGRNGAGKTTAMRMLSGLIKPTSGKATVASFDVGTESESIKKNIGYMSQKFSLYEDLTIKENDLIVATELFFKPANRIKVPFFPLISLSVIS